MKLCRQGHIFVGSGQEVQVEQCNLPAGHGPRHRANGPFKGPVFFGDTASSYAEWTEDGNYELWEGVQVYYRP